MGSNDRFCTLITTVALLCAAGLASAQTPAAGPPQATSATGEAAHGATKLEMEPSLIVMNAHGAILQGQTLTFTGVSTNSIVFADRPVRAAGHMLTAHVLEEWAAVAALESLEDLAHPSLRDRHGQPPVAGRGKRRAIRAIAASPGAAPLPAAAFSCQLRPESGRGHRKIRLAREVRRTTPERSSPRASTRTCRDRISWPPSRLPIRSSRGSPRRCRSWHSGST